MIINQSNLSNLYRSLHVLFQDAFAAVTPTWNRVAMEVPSSTRIEDYSWLGAFPQMREWLGERVAKDLSLHSYTIKNRDWEVTVEVDRNDIEDDTIGIYRPMIQEMGRSAAIHPDSLCWGLLPKGTTDLCYDKKPFFATDHPTVGGAVSNYGGGSGAAWYMFDLSRATKPLIFQNRRAPEFVVMQKPEDESVFLRRKYLYGADRRDNAGYGLWQLAYGSKQTLNATNYGAARMAMGALADTDDGRPLGIVPTLVAVPPSLEGAGREVLKAERNAAGATNIWQGSAELLVVPWLS